MEEDRMVGAHGARSSSEPNLKRKRQRSSTEVIDLSEAATSAPSLRHLPRIRVSPPKQNQPEINLIDDERSSSRPPARQTSKPRRNTATTSVQQSEPPRRSSLRSTVPTTRRSRWREVQNTTNSTEQANTIENDPHIDGDSFLVRRLQAEEEMRAARERRALHYRMQELERAEADTFAAFEASQDRGQQARHPRRVAGGASLPDESPRRTSSRAYNNSLRLFSNARGRYAHDYEGHTSTVERRGGRSRGGGGGNSEGPEAFNYSDHAAAALFTGSGAPRPLPTRPRSGPRRGGRGGGYPPRHVSSSPNPMNFSDALSEMMMRETEAAWRRGDLEHNDDGDDVDGNEDDIEDTFVDEMLLEAALRERERGRPFGPPRRRRGGAGPGRPRDRGEGHISMILNEIAALQQAVLGARNSGLPSEMLFSDRDFTEDDYEALLALDEGVENRKGAKADVINQLHTERVPRKSGGHAGYGDCCICLDRINTGQVVRKLECRHYFHKGCVDKWLKQKATCPICQRKIGEPV